MPQAAAAFPRCHRLLCGAEFGAVFKLRRNVHGKSFSVQVAPNEFGHPRIGIAVSRRVSRKAVVRNRIKRQVRESFRQRQAVLGSIDYVVVAKAKAAEQPIAELRRELERLWRHARNRCEKR